MDRDSSLTPEQLFETLDEDGNKWLHVRELQKALVRVNYDFDAHAVQALTRIFAGGRRGNTALNKQQFVRMYDWLGSVVHLFRSAAKDDSALQRNDVKELVRVFLTQEIKQHRLSDDFNLDEEAFAACFEAADADGNEGMVEAEFVIMCVKLKSLLMTFRAYSTDDDGCITVNFSQLVYMFAHVW